MMFCFHDLIHIILVYLDDLTTQYQKLSQHLDELQQVFLCCHKYEVHLNPIKCVFCVLADHLLRFIISHKGIAVEPVKVQAILNILSPCALRQL